MQPSGSRLTQRSKMLALLLAAQGGEVPLPQIRLVASQYNARIHELRCLGFRIPPPRVEVVNGQRHTWYRLDSGPPPAAVVASPFQSPLDSQSHTDVLADQSTFSEFDLEPEPRCPDL